MPNLARGLIYVMFLFRFDVLFSSERYSCVCARVKLDSGGQFPGAGFEPGLESAPRFGQRDQHEHAESLGRRGRSHLLHLKDAIISNCLSSP